MRVRASSRDSRLPYLPGLRAAANCLGRTASALIHTSGISDLLPPRWDFALSGLCGRRSTTSARYLDLPPLPGAAARGGNDFGQVAGSLATKVDSTLPASVFESTEAPYILVADHPEPLIVVPFTRPVYFCVPAANVISSPLSLPSLIGVDPSVPEIV